MRSFYRSFRAVGLCSENVNVNGDLCPIAVKGSKDSKLCRAGICYQSVECLHRMVSHLSSKFLMDPGIRAPPTCVLNRYVEKNGSAANMLVTKRSAGVTPEVNKAAHSGFETQRKNHQKSKMDIPIKSSCVHQKFKNKDTKIANCQCSAKQIYHNMDYTEMIKTFLKS